MAIARKKIDYGSIEEFRLDPLNPRLGRHFIEGKPRQDQLLEKMKEFSLDELAYSFIDTGFWPQEPLIVVRELLPFSRDKIPRLIVVEGNRRFATVKLLFAARDGDERSKKWRDFVASAGPDALSSLEPLPYMVADSREQVDAYLGFRHVTGIKEWSAVEKAEFIEKLVDAGKSYQSVMRMIGSNTDTVRRMYIAFKLLKQMEDEGEEMPIEDIEDRFSILQLSLRNSRVQSFLGIDIKAEPDRAAQPAPRDKLGDLKDFAVWLFGNKSRDIEPLVPESRDVERFGKILENKQAVAYMRQSESPSFDIAYRFAGGDVSDLVKLLNDATYGVQKALSTVHHHKEDAEVVMATDKLARDFKQLLISFPGVKAKYFPESGNA